MDDHTVYFNDVYAGMTLVKPQALRAVAQIQTGQTQAANPQV